MLSLFTTNPPSTVKRCPTFKLDVELPKKAAALYLSSLVSYSALIITLTLLPILATGASFSAFTASSTFALVIAKLPVPPDLALKSNARSGLLLMAISSPTLLIFSVPAVALSTAKPFTVLPPV